MVLSVSLMLSVSASISEKLSVFSETLIVDNRPFSSLHRIDHLLMRRLLPVRFSQWRHTCGSVSVGSVKKRGRNTSEVSNDIFCLAKIDLLWKSELVATDVV